MSADSIQFYGRETVLDMFSSREAPYWSLWQRKQFLFKGSGADELDTLLEALEKGQSNAAYTLKVYESVSDLSQIKERTEADGSFNFKLHQPEEREAQRMGYRSNLEREVQELKEELRIMREERESLEAEDPLEGMGVIGKVIGLLNEPDKLEKLISIGKSLLSPPAPQYVGNVTRLTGNNQYQENLQQPPQPIQNTQTVNSSKQWTQEELQRVSKALDTIGSRDPQAVDHLEKLAKIAEQNPEQFKTLLSLLDVY